MSESLQPPRIRITMPRDRRDLPGQLVGWRQADDDGRWFAEVLVSVPAGAVAQVHGEDYGQVPRVPAEPRYVLAADTRTKPPTAELHTASCWAIDQRAAWRRVTPLPDADAARAQLQFPGTTACHECKPAP